MINNHTNEQALKINQNLNESQRLAQAQPSDHPFQRFWAVGEKSYFSLIIASISVTILALTVPMLVLLGLVTKIAGKLVIAPSAISLVISWFALFMVVIATIYKEYNQKNYFQYQCQVSQNKSEAMLAIAAHDSTKVAHNNVISPLNRISNVSDAKLHESTVGAHNLAVKSIGKTVEKYWKRHLFFEHIADGSFSIGILFFTAFVIIQFGF